MYDINNCTDCTKCGGCQQSINVDTPTLFCMHCQPSNAPCLKVCNNNAIELLGGAITMNTDKCIKCLNCVEVCPIKIIKI